MNPRTLLALGTYNCFGHNRNYVLFLSTTNFICTIPSKTKLALSVLYLCIHPPSMQVAFPLITGGWTMLFSIIIDLGYNKKIRISIIFIVFFNFFFCLFINSFL
jgi:hypothetical protein